MPAHTYESPCFSGAPAFWGGVDQHRVVLRGLVVYSALRTIESDEEITVNYAGDPDGRIELWFDTKEDPLCS